MDAFLQSGHSAHAGMAVSEIIDYCYTNPDIWSWLQHFDCPNEAGVREYVPLDQEIDYHLEERCELRTEKATAYLEETPFCIKAPPPKKDEEPWRVTSEMLVPSDQSGFKPATKLPLSA
eukprot:1583481-Prorocentrum_lima.AAC.1